MNQIKILVVEDEFLLAADIRNKLQQLGHQVLANVFTGKEAIEQAKAKPDLIFMDIKLKGGMDGIEAATKIRELYDIPIVYLTGYADDDTLERAEQTGCYGYIIKPCREQELKATIRITLKKHQESSQIKFKSSPSAASSSVRAFFADRLRLTASTRSIAN